MHDLDNDGVRRDKVKARSQVTGVISYYLYFAMFVPSTYLQCKAHDNRLNTIFPEKRLDPFRHRVRNAYSIYCDDDLFDGYTN